MHNVWRKKQKESEFPMQFKDYYLIQIVGMVGYFTQLDCCNGRIQSLSGGQSVTVEAGNRPLCERAAGMYGALSECR